MPGHDLSRRLLGLCVLAGLLLAVAPTAIHAYVSHEQLRARAQDHAHGLANSLSRVAARQPSLWRYNAGKVTAAASRHPGRAELGHVRVVDCADKELFGARQLRVFAPASLGPVATAGIQVHGRAVGIVEVALDATRSGQQLLFVGLASALLGLLFGGGLYLLPARKIAVSEAQQRRARLAEGVIQSQEAERRRIAADLHDGLGQHLSAARVAIELGQPEDALASTDDALAELRHAVFHLRPRELDEGGPVEALAAATARFEQRTGIIAAFRHVGGPVPEGPAGAVLLRIAQEALGNVARHAQAVEVGVELTVAPGAITLIVRDDGRGFDPAQVQRGHGLDGMRERAGLLGGEVAVTSGADGTVIAATIPLAARTGR